MLYINEEVKQLIDTLEHPPTSRGLVIFNRLQAWGVLALFNKVNQDLEKLNEELETAIRPEAIGMDIDATLGSIKELRMNWGDIVKGWKIKVPIDNDNQYQINRMTNYLPNGEDGYDVTAEVLGSFRTAMHQLCDEEKITSRAMERTLEKGLVELTEMLEEIKRKIEKPETHLFKKLWEDIMCNYSSDNVKEEYQKWVEETGDVEFADLKAKQSQEIFMLLKSGFFRHCPKPTQGAVKNRKLTIGEDELEVGTKIPEGFDIECTRFEKYSEWRDAILILKYEKLGQYIYKHYRDLSEDDFRRIAYFDAMIDLIHNDMAKMKPNLGKHLKKYQKDKDKALLEELKKIFEPFKPYIRDDLRPTIIEEYLEKLLDSEMKEEAREKMNGQSKNKYCTSIVMALSSSFVFKPEHNNSNEDLGRALHKELDTVTKDTFVQYLKDSKNANKALTSWTARTIEELVKNSSMTIEKQYKVCV